MTRSTMISLAGTVHAPDRYETGRTLCAPGRGGRSFVAVNPDADAQITCKSCLRRIAGAEAQVHLFLDAIERGEADAVRHTGHPTFTADPAHADGLVRLLPVRQEQVGFWLGKGDARRAGDAAYALRRNQVELAMLIAAELETPESFVRSLPIS